MVVFDDDERMNAGETSINEENEVRERESCSALE
jgi:hypothetical protein